MKCKIMSGKKKRKENVMVLHNHNGLDILGTESLPHIFIGENGTIDGQGDVWWNMWRQRTLQFTRPNLVEFVNSQDIIISNVIFKNSPFWNIHPVYCRYN